MALSASRPCLAQAPPEIPFQGYWYVQGEGGISFPASSQEASLYDPGYNGEIQAGYFFTKAFALGLRGSLDFFPLDKQQAINLLEQQYGITGVTGSTTAGFTHFSLDLMGHYYLSFPTTFRVYLLFGAGAAFDSLGGNFSLAWRGMSLSGAFVPESWVNLELVPGLGADFPISDQMDIFAEGKLVLDYVPTEGPNPESNGTPIVGIPVQAGVLYHFP